MSPPMTISSLAKALGVSYQTVWNWTRRESGMPSDYFPQVARILGRYVDELAGWVPEGSRLDSIPRYDSFLASLRRSGSFIAAEPGSDPYTRQTIPVLGTARVGENGFYDFIPGGDGHLEGFASDPDAYALRVKGDSMYPAIRDGWFVVVEPGARPVAEQFVAIELHDGRKMIKELINWRTDALVLESVNGNPRLTIPLDNIEAIHAVTSVVHPSKWTPEQGPRR